MNQNRNLIKNIPLTESVVSFIREGLHPENEANAVIIGGILSNGKYVWYANGPRFVVVNLIVGIKVAAWVFGSVYKDDTIKVVCVDEIQTIKSYAPLLLVGINCSLSDSGMLCIFDIKTSRVLRTIQIFNKITCIHVCNEWEILGRGLLNIFEGMVAVGLEGGNVLLVDLCKNVMEEVNNVDMLRGEVNLCSLIMLTVKDIEILEYYKQKSKEEMNHLALHINAVFDTVSPHFVLKSPKGEDRLLVNKSEVRVSSAFYCRQLDMLVTGYNFGAFQIWDVCNLKLLHISSVHQDNIPVSHIIFQEPNDDPRPFCYLWTIYSNEEHYSCGFPVAVLHSLNFDSKKSHEMFGHIYQDLRHCVVAFQIDLLGFQGSSQKPKGENCIKMITNKGTSTSSSSTSVYDDKLKICSIIWNVWFNDKSTSTYMAVFDLNQWYKEQMPSVPQRDSYHRYMYYLPLTDVSKNSFNFPLDVFIDDKSITQFVGIQKPEEHYYPPSLSFDYYMCYEKCIVQLCDHGKQRALLDSFENGGPLILMKPEELYKKAEKLNMIPLYMEISHSISIRQQREFLMNILLEQQMISCLCKCALAWANGSYSSIDCTMDFFHRLVVEPCNYIEIKRRQFKYSTV